MKNRAEIITISLILTMWFCMAFECTSGRDDKSGSGPISSVDGFSPGHRLSGRWSCSSQGVKSFTFRSDGTFERAGASSGTSSGGGTTYASGEENEGTYDLNGKKLTLNLNAGESETADIRIVPFSDKPDYSEKSPTRLSITNGSYTCLYTNVGSE